MPDEKSSVPVPLQTTLDRAALERVLARAAALQVHTADPAEDMTEAQIVDLGSEVGISSEHVRQALAEERTRVAVPEEQGTVAAWYGPSYATASRVVRGTPASVLAMLDQWMQREEVLQVKRRYVDRVTWEARRDLIGSIKRGFNTSGRGYALSAASEVGATAVAIDESRTLVRVNADVSEARRRRVGASAGVAGLGLTSAAGVVGLTAFLPEASLLIGSVVGAVWTTLGGVAAAAIARTQRRKIASVQLALEQVLDRLEHGEIKGSGLGGIIEAIGTIARR